jgi:hypothetical protein
MAAATSATRTDDLSVRFAMTVPPIPGSQWEFGGASVTADASSWPRNGPRTRRNAGSSPAVAQQYHPVAGPGRQVWRIPEPAFATTRFSCRPDGAACARGRTCRSRDQRLTLV